MKKFILPENVKSNVINGHVFKDGVLIVSDEDAKRLEKVLCRYYGVKMVDVQVQTGDVDPSSKADSSLTVDSTKGGSAPSEEEEEEEEEE